MVRDHVLLVGDDPDLRSLLEQQVDVIESSTVTEALHLLASRRFSLMIARDPLSDGTALSMMRSARRVHPPLKVIVVASGLTAESARDAMRAGADDCLDRHDPGLVRLPWIAARLAAPHPDAPRPLMSSISHDMRSPLAALNALLQMIEDGTDGPLTDAHRSRLARMRAALDRLTALAGQLSDLSLLDDGRLTLSPGKVDLAEAAAAALKQTEPIAKSRAVETRLALPAGLPPLRADAARLRQALTLTIAAVLRQTEGGTVELSAETRGSRLEVRLRELPRSIPVEALPSEFTASEADLSAEPDRLEGSLGVAVARGLLRLHGGDLRTGTVSSGGTLAVIEIPCEETAASGRGDRPRRDPLTRPG